MLRHFWIDKCGLAAIMVTAALAGQALGHGGGGGGHGGGGGGHGGGGFHGGGGGGFHGGGGGGGYHGGGYAGGARAGGYSSGYRGATGANFASRNFGGAGRTFAGGGRYSGNSFVGRHGLASYGAGGLYARNGFGRSGYGGLGGFGFGPYGMGYGGLGFLPFGSGFGGLGYGLGFGGLGYGLGGLGYGRYGGYGGGGYGGYGGYGGGGYGGYGGYGGGYGYPSGGYADSTAPVADDGQQDYVALGEQDFRAGRYNEAVRDWQHALLDDPQNGGLMMLLGQALFATGHFEEAAGATQLGMQLLPQNQWGAVVSNFHELYQGNAYTTQLRALEDSIRSEDSPAKRFLLGYHYAYLGHTADAVRQLDKAVQLNPKDKMAAQLRDLMAGKGGSASATETPELAPAR